MALAICGVRVWDGSGKSVSPSPVVIRVEAGRIAARGPADPRSRDAEIIDFGCEPGRDAVAIPGLIDAHVHMTLDPQIVDPRRQLAVTQHELESAMRSRARAMLRAGITTARDLGGGAWLELALRDRIERGEIEGPRLLCAGQPVTSPRGHCFFWGGEAGDGDEIQRVVRRQIERGADWIKVMATGGVMTQGSRASDAQFDERALRALVSEARAGGRAVAAHCHGTSGIRNAAAAGARTIEHCSFAGAAGFGADLDEAVVELLARREELWVSPTVNAGWARRREKDGRASEFAERMDACLRRLRAAGVPLVASTDAGIPGVRHDGLPAALPVFARYAGLAPLDALRAATSVTARALGLDGETGALRPGLAADLVVVEGNPLRDLTVLSRPRLVVARGRVVAREGAAAPTGSRGGSD